jgi:hypothetical protein
VGTESVDPEIPVADCRLRIADYCRQIESYLCQKNDGHLIRVVGPSFDMVSKWAADGVPLKVAFRGIDRSVERYSRKGRRRPLRIDFCESDVLEVFDEWRRAVGLSPVAAAHEPNGAEPGDEAARERRGASLRAHLERVVRRLTNARVNGGALGVAAPPADDLDTRDNLHNLDDFIDRMSRELDAALAAPRGLRGEARRALIDRLAGLDHELLQMARSVLTRAERQTLEKEALDELAGFRDAMPEAAYQRALEAAMDRLLRERAQLPIVTFS